MPLANCPRFCRSRSMAGMSGVTLPPQINSLTGPGLSAGLSSQYKAATPHS